MQQFALQLPAKFVGSIFITVHFPEQGTSTLPRILNRRGALSAVHATDGESIVPGRIYVAPPDFHLLLSRNRIRLVRGPNETGNRPAVDSMFRSAALTYGPRVIAIVLTGNLNDGTAGVRAIKRRGGLAIAQDPTEALFPSMPRNAIEHASVDRVVPLRELHKTLAELMEEPIVNAPDAVPLDESEGAFAAASMEAMANEPERCRVGHAWSAEAVLAQSDTFDEALWTSLRVLEESASLSRRIADRYRHRGARQLAERFEAQARSIEAKGEPIRSFLMAHRHLQMNPDAGADGPRLME